MSSPFIGEIRMFGGNFAPVGWAFCNGALMPISENDALFNLIGTTYGGDGQETFALPNLQGRVPIHQGTRPGGSTYQIGEMAGTESVTLTSNQTPVHNHPMRATTSVANDTSPQNNVLGSASVDMYLSDVTDVALNNQSIGASGGNQPHDNMAPFLAISFIISLFGIYPSQN